MNTLLFIKKFSRVVIKNRKQIKHDVYDNFYSEFANFLFENMIKNGIEEIEETG